MANTMRGMGGQAFIYFVLHFLSLACGEKDKTDRQASFLYLPLPPLMNIICGTENVLAIVPALLLPSLSVLSPPVP